jgi:hypothetical protein
MLHNGREDGVYYRLPAQQVALTINLRRRYRDTEWQGVHFKALIDGFTPTRLSRVLKGDDKVSDGPFVIKSRISDEALPG